MSGCQDARGGFVVVDDQLQHSALVLGERVDATLYFLRAWILGTQTQSKYKHVSSLYIIIEQGLTRLVHLQMSVL